MTKDEAVFILIRVKVNPKMSGDAVLQIAEEIRSTVEGTFFDQVLSVESETERHVHDFLDTPEALQNEWRVRDGGIE